MEAQIQQFVNETGANHKDARSLLQEQNWNVEAAVRSYKFLQHASRPPMGPQKNREPPPRPVTQPSFQANQTYSVTLNANTANEVGGTNVVVGGSKVPGAGLGMAVGSGSQLAAQGVSGGRGQVKMPNSPKSGSSSPATEKNNLSDKSLVNGAVMRTPNSPSTLNRRLLRGLSKTSENILLVSKARDIVLHDIVEERGGVAGDTCHFVDTPEYTFILPDLTVYPADFRAFLHKDLIETSTLVSLEQAGRLNWWADIGACQRLMPLATTGDGNCLLHAASLGMWGFHDRPLTLRKALYARLIKGDTHGSLYRRWRWHQTNINKQSGLIYDESEWRTEWAGLLKLASTEPRTQPGARRRTSCCDSPATKGLMERNAETNCDHSDSEEVFYESLEEIHVFVLAHVLRRPIIVVADTILKNSDGEPLAPIPFGGLYLPLECKPEECHRSPLLLTYDAAHFSALVPMEGQEKDEENKLAAGIPLVDPEFRLLPIHFLIDPGPEFVWSNDVNHIEFSMEEKLHLIGQYLQVERVLLPSGSLSVGENGDDSRPRANSWSSSRPHLVRTLSIESDESANSREGKEKTKVAKQMQSVAKSFGSIGKTMSKKLKKNFGGGKVPKEKNQKQVGSVTQSTKTGGISVEMLRDKAHLMCAHLLHQRLHYQKTMMDNYLAEAEERFNQDRDLRRQQEAEIREKAEEKRECVNRQCGGQGTAATSYLCAECYDEQKKEERHRSQPQPLPLTVRQAQNRMSNRNDFQRQNTLISSGKSKFYTLSNEDHASSAEEGSPVSDHTPIVDVPPEKRNNASRASAVPLARSSFYDEPLSVGSRSISPDLVKPGTAVVVHNNLYAASDPQLSWPASDKSQSILRHSAELEPPLRPEFKPAYRKVQSMAGNLEAYNAKNEQSPVLRPGLINGQADMSAVEGKYIARVNVNVADDDTHKSDYKNADQKCFTHGCEFFGTGIQDNLCSKCYKEKQRSLSYYAERHTAL